MCVPGKNILKISATCYNIDPYMDNRSFLTVLVRGMALLKTLQRPTLWIYLSLNYKIRLRQHISKHIRQRILLNNEPEPEPERICVCLGRGSNPDRMSESLPGCHVVNTKTRRAQVGKIQGGGLRPTEVAKI